MVSVAEALSAAKAIWVEVSAEAEVIKVSDGAVCGMPAEKAETLVRSEKLCASGGESPPGPVD
jgi:hypothetical protein